MDACSAVIFLGAGRGSLDSQEYISKLLGEPSTSAPKGRAVAKTGAAA